MLLQTLLVSEVCSSSRVYKRNNWMSGGWFWFYKCLIFFSLFNSFEVKSVVKMEAAYDDLATFEKNLYQYKTTEELYNKPLNIILLITHNVWFYCFSEKYQGCKLDYNQRWRLCPLRRIPTYLSNYEEELDCAQFDVHVLKIFGFKLIPSLLKGYCVDKRSLETFSGHFYYSSRDRYTGEKTETSLKDQIKFTTDSGTPANQRNFYNKLLH